MRILCVLGTRPEAIKMAPVIHRLCEFADIEVRVCVSGQHRQLLDPMLQLFGIVPDFDLDVMSEDQTLPDITAQILSDLPAIFKKISPDLVLVQGDTATSFAASLAAYYRNIPVAHIEAGLRSHNILAPFPEEANRCFISRVAKWHFAPTETARSNLLSENIDPDMIHVTGNTVIDALLWTKDQVIGKDFSHVYGKADDSIHSGLPIILVTGQRRENVGQGFENICRALSHLAKRHSDWHFVYPVHLNPSIRRLVMENLSNIHNIHLIAPLDYAPFVKLMNCCKLIITDSGGIQEEAPSLGKPVLVTRKVTERPEAVEAGTSLMVGTDFTRIIQETESLMLDDARYARMVGARNPYGDGRAASRIIEILIKKLKLK